MDFTRQVINLFLLFFHLSHHMHIYVANNSTDEPLSDSESIQEQIVRDMLNKYGKSYPLDLRFRVLGMPTDVAMILIVNTMNLPITPAAFKKDYIALCKERLLDLDLKEGLKMHYSLLSLFILPIYSLLLFVLFFLKYYSKYNSLNKCVYF